MTNSTLEALDFKYLLLEYYKKLKLKENEVMVILMIDHLLSQNNKLITADLLSIKMNIPQDEIDRILVNLIDKKIIEYDTSKSMKTSIKPLREKLVKQFERSINNSDDENDKNKNAYLKNIYQVLEQELGRSLSPVHFSKVQDWIDDGFTDEEILNAIREIKAKNKKVTLQNIDKLLISYRSRQDIEKTGYSFVGKDWDKSVEETIKIANKILDED